VQVARRAAHKIAAVIVVLAPALARAVSPAAEALFEDGRRLMAAGQTAEACKRFAESNALEPSSGKLLNLALCHEQMGKTATAWAEYRAAARLARDQGRADRAAVADAKVAELEPALAHLTPRAAAPVPGLKIALGEMVLDETALGVLVPVDPGEHEVVVSAPGRRAWTGRVTIANGERRTIEIPALEEEVALVPPPPPEPPARLVGGEPPAPTTGRRSIDFYGAVGGGFLVAAGTALYGTAVAKWESGKAACGTGCADADGRVATIHALEYSGIGCWVAGGSLLAASALHYVVARRAKF
jgi:hypothetical protein